MPKPGKPKIPDFDAHATVVDDHTGKVLATFQGLGAEEDARHHQRLCSGGRVKHMSSTSVLTGKEAARVGKAGRV